MMFHSLNKFYKIFLLLVNFIIHYFEVKATHYYDSQICQYFLSVTILIALALVIENYFHYYYFDFI